MWGPSLIAGAGQEIAPARHGLQQDLGQARQAGKHVHAGVEHRVKRFAGVRSPVPHGGSHAPRGESHRRGQGDAQRLNPGRGSRLWAVEEWDDLAFAWAAIFGVKSNAILLAKDGGVLGIGAGQMSRVDSSKIAVRKAGDAGHALTGSVLASDAFFPFPVDAQMLRVA